MFELEPARRAETDGGDDGVAAQFRLVVAVPGHAVALAAIVVEQDTVERDPGGSIDALADREQRGRPRPGRLREAGVGVCRAGIAVPGGEPRHLDLLAVEPDRLPFPGDPGLQGREEGVRLLRREEAGIEEDFGVGHGELEWDWCCHFGAYRRLHGRDDVKAV